MEKSVNSLTQKDSYIPPAVETVIILPKHPLLQDGSAEGEDAGDEYYWGY